jgi:hypothetical protein
MEEKMIHDQKKKASLRNAVVKRFKDKFIDYIVLGTFTIVILIAGAFIGGFRDIITVDNRVYALEEKQEETQTILESISNKVDRIICILVDDPLCDVLTNDYN